MKNSSGGVFDLEHRFRLEDEWLKNKHKSVLRRTTSELNLTAQRISYNVPVGAASLGGPNNLRM